MYSINFPVKKLLVMKLVYHVTLIAVVIGCQCIIMVKNRYSTSIGGLINIMSDSEICFFSLL